MRNELALHIHRPSLNLRYAFPAEAGTPEARILSPLVKCYAYALNLPRARGAIPGNLAEAEYRGMSKGEIKPRIVRQRLLKDGLEEITSAEALSGDFHAVACVMKPARLFRSYPDFHFLRLDHASGTWSHKPGHILPMDVDDEEDPIDNPETAKFYEYDAFCGFFAITKRGILYVPRDEDERIHSVLAGPALAYGVR